MEEVRYHRQNEEEYENLIKELKHDVIEIKDKLNEIRKQKQKESRKGAPVSEMTLKQDQYKQNEGCCAGAVNQM